MNGPTDPNRLYLWSGTAGPGRDGTTGPLTDNTAVTDNPAATGRPTPSAWRRPASAGRSTSNPDGSDDRDGDYDDNGAVATSSSSTPSPQDDPRYVNAMTRFDLTALRPATARTAPCPGLLAGRARTCSASTPTASPTTARTGSNTALQSLFANPEVWEHTVFL